MRSYKIKERTSEAIKDGFDENPTQKQVESGTILIVYRAHGNLSKMIGRFFFTPQIAGTPRINWTADMLERELNAALWDNDFRYLAKFRVLEGVKYKIGPIAHDKYQGVDFTPSGGRLSFDQYSYFRNANMFLQVQIDGITPSNWHEYLDLLEAVPIKAERFHRGTGRC
ncbi:hypothetical protein V2P20_04215 [Methylobacter sp. Wu1]|jgi:hypothetical protein|uniref:hypothetical protein n=1 Tax=Methylobacter sp. Wu1 TaxID=3119359 RepID=UPI002F91EDCE